MVDPPWLVLWKIGLSIIVRPYRISRSVTTWHSCEDPFFLPNHSHAWYLLDLSRCVSECVCLFLRFLSWPSFDIHFEYFSFYSLWYTYPYLVILEGFKYVMILFMKTLTNLTLCHLLIGIYPSDAQGEILLSPSLILIWNVLCPSTNEPEIIPTLFSYHF